MTVTIEPRCQLYMPGTWLHLDPADSTATTARIRAYVRRMVGTSDKVAQVRRAMTERLQGLVSSGAQSVFVCEQISPGVAFPMTVSVSVVQAVGDEPLALIAARVGGDGADGEAHTEWESLECRSGTAIRSTEVTSVALELPEDTPADLANEQLEQHSLRLTAWLWEPGSDHLVLLSASTPMADIPHLVTRLFDGIVATAVLRL